MSALDSEHVALWWVKTDQTDRTNRLFEDEKATLLYCNRFERLFIRCTKVTPHPQSRFKSLPPCRGTLLSPSFKSVSKSNMILNKTMKTSCLWVKNAGYPKNPMGKSKNKPKPVVPKDLLFDPQPYVLANLDMFSSLLPLRSRHSFFTSWPSLGQTELPLHGAKSCV